MIFKCPNQLLINWFSAKGYNGNINEMALAYFYNITGVSNLNLDEQVGMFLSQNGFSGGTVRDMLTQFFYQVTGILPAGENDIAFFGNTSLDFLDFTGLLFSKNYEITASNLNADYSSGSPTATLTAARSSTNPHTYFDNTGTIQLLTTANVGRFTRGYYDATGFHSNAGMLIEGAQTNLLTHSNDFTQADWTKSNINTNSGSDIVQAGGYDAIITSGTANFGGGTTERHFLNNNQKSRIRQNGTITTVEIYLKTLPVQLTAFYFEVWRYNGTTWDRISQENILASLLGATDNTVTLSTPVACLEGDYVGYGWTCATTPGSFLIGNTGFATNSTYFVTDAAPSSSGYNWAAQTSSTTLVPLKVYMAAPSIVFIGDSIIAGHLNNFSFIETTSTAAITSAIPYLLGSQLNYTYQNMGIGGQSTSTINSRFTADCVNLKPRYAVINGGVNDIIGNGTEATFLAKWTSILNACSTNNIIPIVMLITPWTGGANSQMQQRDIWNRDLAALVASYAGAISINLDSTVGQFREGGDPGNLWDQIPSYTTDNIHFTATGYTQIANAIYNAMLGTSIYPTKYPDLLIATAGNATVLEAQTIASGVNTFSIFLKRRKGTGTINITADGGSTWTAATLTTNWRRFSVTQTLANPSCGIQIVTSGDEVYAIFAQNQALDFPTSPIPTTSAAVTSSSENISYVNSGNRSDVESLFLKFSVPYAVGPATTGAYFMDTETKRRRVIISAGNTGLNYQPNSTDSSGVTVTNKGTLVANTSTVFTFVSNHSSPYAETYQDGVSKGQYTAGDYTTPAWGTRFSIGSVVGGTTWSYGIIKRISIYNSAFIAAQVVSAYETMKI